MIHVIPISGKDSLCTALIASVHNPEIDYQYIFCDTETELPETYSWLSEIEKKMGWKIQRVGKDLEEIIRDASVLPSVKMRFCTRIAKIKPFEDFFKKEKAVTVYYGLRYDEPDRKGYIPHNNIIPKYPLREHRITLPLVLGILNAKGLKPPTFFWKTLHEKVNLEMTSRIPLFPWESAISDIEFDLLFSGRSRSNCYFCFFQRQYEWIWLSEAHPNLFKKAIELENVCGSSDYNWRSDYSLSSLLARKDEIIEKRTKQVANYIESKMGNVLFGANIPLDNEIALTSCGVLCGK